MANVFINGFNAKAGGGKSILVNFLSLLAEKETDHTYYILVPKAIDYYKFKSNSIVILDLPEIFEKQPILPFVYRYILPKLIRKHSCNLIFNLADIPIPIYKKQIFLFDWPYAVYPTSSAWKMMDFNSWFSRKVKLFLFKRNLNMWIL